MDTSHTNPILTTTASGLLRVLQKPLLEPLLHLIAWIAPLVWVMAWLGYLNGSSHLAAMIFGFAGSGTRGQLDHAARYNAEAWPAVQARETLAMFRYDATHVLDNIPVPAIVFTGHLDRLIVPETADFLARRLPVSRLARLEPAGHMAVFERHDRLSTDLAAFAERALSARQTLSPQSERLAS